MCLLTVKVNYMTVFTLCSFLPAGDVRMLKGRIKNVAHMALVRLTYSLTCETCELANVPTEKLYF